MLLDDLILTEQLFPHLSEINKAAENRIRIMLPQMKKQRGVTEELKSVDQMRWVQEMVTIRTAIEEIIQRELICV